MPQDLFTKIRSLETKLSQKQKRVAPYFLAHPEELPFQTTSEIASKTGVSEPTVIRFVRLLGFKGFTNFKDELQRMALEKFGPSGNRRKVKKINKSLKELVGIAFEREIQNLRETQEELTIPHIEAIVNAIINANKKYIIGLRNSAGCAHVLGRTLSHILPDITVILDGDTRLYEGLRSIGKGDVLITVSYPRYIKTTVDAVRFSKDRKATTISITDSEVSPAAQISKFAIIAPSNSITFANSYTACFSVINLLTAAIININSKEKTEAVLKEWENAIGSFDFFVRG